MNIRKFILGLLLLALPAFANAQKSDYSSYPFIKPSIDTLEYDSTALKSFFTKLKELKEGKRKNLVIVHIGDSHIQADFFSGWVREQLQRDYGDGGRGLIFPYRAAGSNEPLNFHSYVSGKWIGHRCALPHPDIPIGVAGFSVRTYDTAASLAIKVKDADSLNYSFNKILFFHDSGPQCFDWVFTDSTSPNPITIHSKRTADSITIDSLTFPTPTNFFNMQVQRKDTTQREGTIYGFVLSNNKPGIIYHTIGANGAMFINYLTSQYFMQQLKALKPDLVIISLGTNEAYSRGFNANDFSTNADDMLTNIRLVCPGTDFLLTTPPDGYRYHRYRNLSIPDAVDALRKVAATNHAAFWDFYHIMGGYTSMYKWYQRHLSQRDLLHFNSYGYTLQAQLFYDALHKAITHEFEQSAP